MTNPILTQAEIDAMEALLQSIHGIGRLSTMNCKQAFDLQNFEAEARTFIPKAIARIRELECAFDEEEPLIRTRCERITKKGLNE